MLPIVARRVKQAVLILVAVIATALIAGAFLSRSKPDLELWHTTDLEAEFKAEDAETVTTFQDYRKLEDRLFKELHRKVISPKSGSSTNRLNRYNPEGVNNALKFSHHWNRSYELNPAQIRGSALLLHGLTDSPYSLHRVAKILAQNGFYVLGLRLPGHGTIPAGIASATVKDWTAAVRIGARQALSRKPAQAPFLIVGYSNGAALAVKYALDSLEKEGPTAPDRLILFSPAIGITPLAAMADLHKAISFIPQFKKFQWTQILPEYDPYKYTSFPKNAAQQTYNLTVAIQKQIGRLKTANRLSGFPPTLTFQSVADSTVRTDAIVTRFYDRLDRGKHEFVLFDINRDAHTRPFLKADFQQFIDKQWTKPQQPYRLTVITNIDETSPQVVAWIREARGEGSSQSNLELEWPEGIYSLSHVALPFPPDDPVYGNRHSSRPTHGMNLGALEPRGETNMLRVSIHSLMRLRYNPFFPYIEQRIVETIR